MKLMINENIEVIETRGRGGRATYHHDFLAQVQGLAIIEPPSPRITRSQSTRKN